MNVKARVAKLEAEADQESSELYSSFRMVAEVDQEQHIAEMRAAGHTLVRRANGFTLWSDANGH